MCIIVLTGCYPGTGPNTNMCQYTYTALSSPLFASTINFVFYDIIVLKYIRLKQSVIREF